MHTQFSVSAGDFLSGFLCYVIMDKMRNWQSHIAYGSEDWGDAEDVTKDELIKMKAVTELYLRI